MSDEGNRLNQKKGADKPDPFIFKLAKYTAIGLQFPFMVIGGLLLGYLLDLYFGTFPWLSTTLTLLSLFGAFVQMIRLFKYLSKED